MADRTSPGPATDSAGVPVLDPTANVLGLVEAANKRQDDLRAMERRHVRELLGLQSKTRRGELQALDDIGRIRAEHARELREAEAARINAIRAVDVGNVQQAAQVQATQANTLAAQVAVSAETLRTQVAAAATAAQTGLAAALEPIIKDIADLRRAQYEAQGQKTQVVETQAKGANSGLWWIVGGTVVFGTLMFVLAAITLAALVTHGFTK